MSKHFIRLERLTVDKDALHYEFSTSLDLFRKKDFMIRYEGLSPDGSESIRMVPFAALMAPVAMAAGAELSMPSLDKDFAGSLRECEAHWKKHFPKWDYSNYRLNTEITENSAPHSGRPAVMFSCGLDSIAAYLHNRADKPHLLSILGADIPLSHADFIAVCREKLFDEFAKKEGVGITYIHTDIRETTDPAKLRKFAPSWYASVQFGILLTGLTAPISYGRFSKVILASCSHQEDDTAPCAGDPGIVRRLRWGSTRVEDQLQEVSRVQKVGNYLKADPSTMRYLRVCWEQFEKVNCSRCKKCLRTICELLVNNVDPNLANFSIDENTLPELRKKLSSEFHLFFNCEAASINFWREIRQAIDLKTLKDQYGSKVFFEWLLDLKPLKIRESPLRCRTLHFIERAKKAGPSKVFKRFLKILSGTR